jgi:L-rhamnose mutarotase
MDYRIQNSINEYLNNLYIIKDMFKESCSEITLKISALNLCSSKHELNREFLRELLGEIDFTAEVESRLILRSLCLSATEDVGKLVEDIKSAYTSLVKTLPRGIYTILCAFIISCTKENRIDYIEKFSELYNELRASHSISNVFEYSPFVLLATLSGRSVREIVEKSKSIYLSLHEAAFARGTNSYCTSLYLSSIDKSIDANMLRNLYTELKKILPLNQFNYLSTAQLYVCNEGFNDYDCIADIFKGISVAQGFKWFSDQLDMAIATALYLKSQNFNPLSYFNLEIDEQLSPCLLATMISLTLLLNYK